MEIPQELKIGGHRMRVELVDLPDDIDGEYDNQELLISINRNLPQSMKESTLIHEIMHALNGTFDSETFAHSLLDSMAEQLYQVLKDNQLLR